MRKLGNEQMQGLLHKASQGAYTAFADVYDSFMRNIPYNAWSRSLNQYLTHQNLKGCEILELGCGTGSMSIRLAKEGYHVSGIDLSPQMLAKAQKRSRKAGLDIYYEQQDMRALEWPETVPVVFSFCDSMNYLMDLEELEAVFSNVYQILKPGGLFIFDLKTEKFYRDLGNQTFTDTNELGTYIWENEYDEESRNNYYELTLFIRRPMGLFIRQSEEHTQHAFRPEEIFLLAEKSGFSLKDHLGVGMNKAADLQGERTYFVLKKPDNEI